MTYDVCVHSTTLPTSPINRTLDLRPSHYMTPSVHVFYPKNSVITPDNIVTTRDTPIPYIILISTFTSSLSVLNLCDTVCFK